MKANDMPSSEEAARAGLLLSRYLQGGGVLPKRVWRDTRDAVADVIRAALRADRLYDQFLRELDGAVRELRGVLGRLHPRELESAKQLPPEVLHDLVDRETNRLIDRLVAFEKLGDESMEEAQVLVFFLRRLYEQPDLVAAPVPAFPVRDDGGKQYDRPDALEADYDEDEFIDRTGTRWRAEVTVRWVQVQAGRPLPVLTSRGWQAAG